MEAADGGVDDGDPPHGLGGCGDRLRYVPGAGRGEPPQGIGHGGDGPGERVVPGLAAAALAVLPPGRVLLLVLLWPRHGAGLLVRSGIRHGRVQHSHGAQASRDG